MKAILFLSLMFLLSACSQVAVTGAQAVYNRHSLQKEWDDQYITMQAYKALKIDTDAFKDANISISTFHHEVLLAGQAPQSWQKEKAEQIVQGIPNISHIYNLVIVSNPSSSLKRISDAWITGKVKAKLIASSDVDASEVKVVTENGTVFLMGYLSPGAADAAVDIASNTDGVERVIKIFSYITISKKLAMAHEDM